MWYFHLKGKFSKCRFSPKCEIFKNMRDFHNNSQLTDKSEECFLSGCFGDFYPIFLLFFVEKIELEHCHPPPLMEYCCGIIFFYTIFLGHGLKHFWTRILFDPKILWTQNFVETWYCGHKFFWTLILFGHKFFSS